MELKISEISRMTGISPSGIRYYEKAGVISPQRGKNQKYRNFSMHELHLLMLCKTYREYGFSLQETIDFLNRSDSRQIKTGLESLRSRLDREIREKQLLLDLIDERTGNYAACPVDDTCIQSAQMPALIRVKLWQPGSRENEFLPFEQFSDWAERYPFVESSLLLSKNTLLYAQGEIETDWGLAIEQKYAQALNFYPQSAASYIPACTCIQLIVKVSEDLTISSSQLNDLRNFLAENHLHIAGPAVSRLLNAINIDDQITRLDCLWIPIEKS